MDRRRPSRRPQRDEFGNYVYGMNAKGRQDSGANPWYWLALALLAVALVASLAVGIRTIRASGQVRKGNAISTTHTSDGSEIRWYVLTDPGSQVQYLVNDLGGVTPRLDRHGNVVGVLEEEPEEPQETVYSDLE